MRLISALTRRRATSIGVGDELPKPRTLISVEGPAGVADQPPPTSAILAAINQLMTRQRKRITPRRNQAT